MTLGHKATDFDIHLQATVTDCGFGTGGYNLPHDVRLTTRDRERIASICGTRCRQLSSIENTIIIRIHKQRSTGNRRLTAILHPVTVRVLKEGASNFAVSRNRLNHNQT